MTAAIQLIIGLGNPGLQYQTTRHNVGQWFIERLAVQESVALKLESKLHAELARVDDPDGSFRIAKPTVFMNESGRAVQAIKRFYQLEPSQILVVHDELDFSPGKVRLKFDGGHGGHNGLRDIIQALGSNQFWRLRVGIGHPGQREKVHRYVLTKPSISDQALIDEGLAESLRVLPQLLRGEYEQAMNQLHEN